jgi:serine/threonine-protein kinase
VGSTVDLKVSRGVVVVKVPDVTGRPQADAETLLKDTGLGVKATKVYSDAPSGQVTEQSPAAGSSLNEGAVVNISVSQGPLPVAAVPNVVGQSEADATKALQAPGFVVKTNQAYSPTAPAGTVVAQTPPGGVFAQRGATVEVTVSQGPPPPDAVAIPDVMGKTEEEATAALEAAGFKVEVVTAYSETAPEGAVLGQAPSADLSSPPGAIVTIAVSQGPPPAAAPLPATPTT